MKRRTSKEAGSSLVELVFGVAILGVVLATLAQMTQSSEQLTDTSLTLGRIDESASRASHLIAAELRWARPSSILVTEEAGADRVDFVVAQDVDGTDPVWSTPITLRFEPSAVDTNGNGVADEGSIVRIQNGRRRVLCSNVSAGGLRIDHAGETITVSLDVFGVTDDAAVLERTVDLATTILNTEEA